MAKKKIVGDDVGAYAQKKPFYKRIWFILLILAVLVVAISSIGGSEDSPNDATDATEGMTPQQIDLEMYRPVRSAQASFEELNNMMLQLDSGQTSLAEIYDKCEQVKDWGIEWTDIIDSMTTEETAAYAEAAENYVQAVSYGLASSLADYIDENDYECYSTAKDALTLIPVEEETLNQARRDYLADAGLTEEEIQQQIDLG